MEEIKTYYALTQKAFNSLAPVYNLMTLPLAHVRDKVVKLNQPIKNGRILDVATGTGQQAFAFARHGYDVIGIDITESMLEVAHRHNKHSCVHFETGDATHLRFEENTFDITCISFALHDMPPVIREKVVQEMARVTKRNGMMVIVDYDLSGNKFGRALMYRLITIYEGKYYKQFIRSDLETVLRKAGIDIIARHSILLGAGRIIRGVKRTSIGKLATDAWFPK